jgi:hypothetical protein
MNCVGVEVVGVRVTHAVSAGAFHHSPISAPELRPIDHMMITRVMDRTSPTFTQFAIVNLDVHHAQILTIN